MTIDPRFSFWFAVSAAIVSGLLLCGAEFTTLFGDIATSKILAGLGIFNVVANGLNALLHAIPSQQPPTPAAAKQFYLGPTV